MKRTAVQIGLTTMALAISASIHASSIVIDDFLGGPDTVTLVSLKPPQIAASPTGFAHSGAIGGYRDAAVWSKTKGSFSSGVSFNSGGYASFAGKGEGVMVWDGIPGLADSNKNKRIDVAEIGLG